MQSYHTGIFCMYTEKIQAKNGSYTNLINRSWKIVENSEIRRMKPKLPNSDGLLNEKKKKRLN